MGLIHIYEWMTSEQITRVLFPSRKVARRRLGKLVKAGHLRGSPVPEPPHYGQHRLAYTLTDSRTLDPDSHGSHKETPSWHPQRVGPTPHHIAVVDSLIAFECHARSSAGRIGVEVVPEWSISFSDGMKFRRPLEMAVGHPRSQGTKTSVIPDAALCLFSRSGRKSLFFLELDRGTVPIEFVVGRETLRLKMETYEVLDQEEGYGLFSEIFDYPFSGFRVLFVCTSSSRARTASRLASKVGTRRILTATFEDVIRDGPLSRIWVPPSDPPARPGWLTSLRAGSLLDLRTTK